MATVDQPRRHRRALGHLPGAGLAREQGHDPRPDPGLLREPGHGINVIARNVADPFHDCTSYISGQVSREMAGPDGSFVMNGLTPGASYVLYTDQLMDGAFSVPGQIVLPGPEEYFNGPLESGDGSTDDRCALDLGGRDGRLARHARHHVQPLPGAPTFITAPDLSVRASRSTSRPDGGVVVGARRSGEPRSSAGT